MGIVGGLLKATMGGGGRRMMTGGIVGGIYGAASAEGNDVNAPLRGAVLGFGAGMGLGALTTRTFGKSFKRSPLGSQK